MQFARQAAGGTASAPSRPTIILWTAPRCLSTAFERAVVQLGQIQAPITVHHEPYSLPFYYSPTERGSARYENEPAPDDSLPATYAGVRAALATPGGYSKDMAYYVRGRGQAEVLPTTRHTFLIRDPRKAIPSLWLVFQPLTGDPKNPKC